MPQVGHCVQGTPVEQRREEDHQGARWQRGPRHAVQVRGGLAGEADAERHFHDPEELPVARGGSQPPEHPAEYHHADPVAGPQVGGGQARSTADREVKSGIAGRPDVGERVDHDHQVGGAQGRPLVDVRLAQPACHRPVQVAQPVAGLVPANAEELDTRAGRRRGVLADPPQQVGRQQAGPGRRWVREDLYPSGPERQARLAHPVGAPGRHGAELMAAPGVRLEHPAGAGRLPGHGHLAHRAIDDGHRRAGLDPERHLVHRGRHGGDDLDILALETARRGRGGGRIQGLRPGAPAGRRERGQGGRAEQQQVGVPGQDRHEDDGHSDHGQPAQPGRGLPGGGHLRQGHHRLGQARSRPPRRARARRRARCQGHGRARHRWLAPHRWRALGHWLALGTGSAVRISVIRSSPVTLRTHISGRSTRRCARAATATALTSSGIT